MAKFIDKEGDNWEIVITIGKLRRLKEKGINLLRMDEQQIDPVLLVDILYEMCKEQARERGLNLEAFERKFDGDVVVTASEALGEAFADFFPARKTQILEQMRMAEKM